MSNHNNNHHHNNNHTTPESHESPIKTPKQLITVVLLSFIVPIVLLILLAQWVDSGNKPGAGTDVFGDKSINMRIKPVAFTEYKVPGSEPIKTGEQVYNEVCAGCHTTGAAGAPKLGDVAGWSNRITKGLDGLLAVALKGQGSMPSRGGNPDLTDIEIKNAIVYMANQSGATFKESVQTTQAVIVAPVALTPPAITPPVITPPTTTITPPPQPEVNVGKKLYDSTCSMCHNNGVAGAPKLGDKTAWSVRSKVGVDGLTASVIKGKNAMPPRGGASQATDDDLKQAVQYILSTVK